MKRYAKINLTNNTVINVLMWNGSSEIWLDENETLVELQENEICSPNYTYANTETNKFLPPTNNNLE